MIGSQLSDEEGIISVQGQDVTVSQYIDGTYGFSKDRVWYSALILVGFCIAFWFVVAGEYQSPAAAPLPLLLALLPPAVTSSSGCICVRFRFQASQ